MIEGGRFSLNGVVFKHFNASNRRFSILLKITFFQHVVSTFANTEAAGHPKTTGLGLQSDDKKKKSPSQKKNLFSEKVMKEADSGQMGTPVAYWLVIGRNKELSYQNVFL